jgi:murein tripeptide amidase MpaA
MHIDSNFDGGNIAVLEARDPAAIRLAIAPDHRSHYFQWFAFRLAGARGRPCTIRIENAGAASYASGWNGYRGAASSDRRSWRRVASEYDGATLTLRLTPEHDVVWIAYFALHTEEDHELFLGRALASPRSRLAVLGHSLDGRPMDCLTLGEAGAGKRVAWVVARQHSGETMASYFIEGMCERLLDDGDALSRRLLERLVFHVVPNMNPDGSRRGHLRCNAAGVDLNREWATPTLARSPEVFLVRERMIATGVDFCLDVHGDEVRPHNFLIGSHRVPSQTPAMTRLFERYVAALAAATPDFRAHNGHWSPGSEPANLTLCSHQVAERFGCLAMTMEMPFKDESDHSDAATGWSPARSRALGRHSLEALAAVADALR